MKKIIAYFTLVIMITACDTENANDCFQATGTIIAQEIAVAPFTKIRVNRDVELILTEGAIQKVEIETGENLINDVTVVVSSGRLIITENNTCNLLRDYNVTKVYVTAPNITEIISATQFIIRSNGVLNYDEIKLLSEDFTDTTVLATGKVILSLNSQNVIVVGNNLTDFTLSGTTDNLNVTFASGDGVFNAENLVANTVTVFHRGTNKMIVNPQNELSGQLRSTGNLIAKNRPSIVNVEQFYTGILIFE